MVIVEIEKHLTVNPSSSEYVGSNPTAPKSLFLRELILKIEFIIVFFYSFLDTNGTAIFNTLIDAFVFSVINHL